MNGRLSYRYAAAAAILLAAAARFEGTLAWLVTGALVIAIHGASGWGRAAAAGALFGVLVALLGDADWVAMAVQSYFQLPSLQVVFGVVLSALVCGASLGAILGLALRSACTAGERVRALLVGAIWVAWESLVVAVLPHHPWASLAATQGTRIAPLQTAALAGQGGLSFVLATAGAALGLAYCRRRDRPVAAYHLAVGLAIAGLCGVGGWARVRTAEAPAVPACTVAAIDAEITSKDLAAQAVLARYEARTLEMMRSPADAVVWPESALLASPELDAKLQARLRADAARWQTVLIAGGPRFGWTGDWTARAFNSVYRIAARGPLEVYDKRVLVPFAEYWPAPVALLPPLVRRAVVPGSRAAVFTAGDCRLGVLVCFEEEHPELIPDLVDRGATALLIVSNDAHLSPRAIGLQVAQARLRAVESGMSVVRAANRGASVAIDRFGRVRQETHGGGLAAAVWAGAAAPAVRTSGPFLRLCWAIAVLGGITAFRQWRAGLSRAEVVEAVEDSRRRVAG